MSSPPDWAVNVPPNPAVHTDLPLNYQWENLTQEQLEKLRGQLIEMILQVVVQAITGLFVPGAFGAALQQLSDWAEGIPIIGDIVEAITGFFGDLTDLSAWFTNLIGLLGDPLNMFLTPILGPLEDIPILGPIIEAITGGTTMDLTSWFGDFLGLLGDPTGLGTGSPFMLIPEPSFSNISPPKINGLINPWQIAVLPSDWIGDTHINLLTANNFDTVESVAAEKGWSWSTDNYTGSGGSATVVADGIAHNELLSSEVHVSRDQVLATSVQVKWSGLSYTGSDPISLGLTRYARDPSNGSLSEIGSDTLATIAAPASSGGWSELAADYTVPAGTDAVRLKFRIPKALSAGQVWWDAAKISNRTSLMNNLANKFLGFDNTFGWSISEVADALHQQSNALTWAVGQINTLQGQVSSNVTNPGTTAVRDDFSVAGSSLGSNWDENYSAGNGSWKVASGNAAWNTVFPGAQRSSVNRWIGTGTSSTTDYQTVAVVLGSAPMSSGSFSGSNTVIGRCDTAAAPGVGNYIEFGMQFTTGSWWLDKVVSGVHTTMAFGDTTPPGKGSVLQLVCGNKATSTVRHFTVSLNSEVLASGTFSDTTSLNGASYRGWGFGGTAQGATFGDQYRPGQVNYWTAQDT